MSAELALRGAVNVLWRADAAVGALVGDRIYDRVPTNPTFPYVTLGEVQSLNEDADWRQRYAVILTSHAWSRAVGQVEALQIAQAMRDAVRGATRGAGLTASGYLIAGARHRDTRVFLDQDGLTTHAVVVFEAIIDKEG